MQGDYGLWANRELLQLWSQTLGRADFACADSSLCDCRRDAHLRRLCTCESVIPVISLRAATDPLLHWASGSVVTVPASREALNKHFLKTDKTMDE